MPGVFDITEMQYELVFDALSFTLASMMATTLFLWIRIPAIHEKYKSPLLISGLVTFIAAYHYFRIFDSWGASFTYAAPVQNSDGTYDAVAPVPTGVPFNDAYRYIDWLMTVPLLLMEIVLVMKLDAATASRKCLTLGVSSALMIVIGYPGELILDEDELWKRWIYWAVAIVPFIYIIYELFVGLAASLNEETDERIKSKIWWAQRVTVVSWLTYPIVYVIPMMGATGTEAIVGIQMGYCISDIISKCGLGLLIYKITLAKSRALQKGYENVDAPLVES